SAYDSSLLKYDTTFVFDTYDAEDELSSSSLWYKKYQLLYGDNGYDYNLNQPSYNRIDGFYAFQLVNPIDVPEPATGVLVLTGLGLLLRRRRRVG
ncbi:MAG: PEP-CTERM sorting domain-containing protein, partial [Akkermansia sp.]